MPKILVALTSLFATLAAIPASAQQSDQHLFHVTHDTYGCVNPRATLAITNRDDPRQRDPGWVAYLVEDGHCAPISPRSPWRVVSVQGELAYMTYAGTTGLPGSFYLRLSDLVELAPPPEPVPPAEPTPPPFNPAFGPVAEPQPAGPAPGNNAPTGGYINPPEAASPLAAPRTVSTPAKPPARRQDPPQPVVRVQPRPAQQPASASVSIGAAGEDGRSAGAALAVLIVLGCGFKWMRGASAGKNVNTVQRREPST